MQNDLHLLDAQVRHLGTDINYIVLEHLFDHLQKQGVEFHFHTHIDKVEQIGKAYRIHAKDMAYDGDICIISTGRSGSKWAISVKIWESKPDPIVLTSEYGWNCRQRFSLI